MLLVGSVFITVLTRYVLGNPVLWGVEVGRILLVWITFIGAILVAAEGEHVRLSELMEKLLGDKLFKSWDKIVNVLTIIFLSILGYYIVEMMQVVSDQTTHALRIPYNIFYLPMLLFCVLSILYIIEGIIRGDREVKQT
jgi:TRAP-type C4-dicarboxylate transport system permease small subunit